MRPALTPGVLLMVAGLVGCGGDDAGRQDASALAREAAAAVEKLERAIARREFGRICAELLSAEVRRQAGGGDCPGMLARTSAGVRRPSIQVRKIEARGRVATVEVVTTAAGQARVEDTIRLVQEGGRYRISSLSG